MAPVLPTFQTSNSIFSIVQNTDNSNISIVNGAKPTVTPQVTKQVTTTQASVIQPVSVQEPKKSPPKPTPPPTQQIKPKSISSLSTTGATAILPAAPPPVKEIPKVDLLKRAAADGGNDAKITLKIGQWKPGVCGDDDRLISIKNVPKIEEENAEEPPVCQTAVKMERQENGAELVKTEGITIKQDEADAVACPIVHQLPQPTVDQSPTLKVEITNPIPPELEKSSFRARTGTGSIGIIMSPVIGRKRKRYKSRIFCFSRLNLVQNWYSFLFIRVTF